MVDEGAGVPTSVEGLGAQLRVEVAEGVIDSEDAASAYVTGLRSGVTVLSVEMVEQFGSTGFRVAYTVPTVEGPTQSGAVLLLNGTDQTHIANVLL
ncbi:MAG: hypothetical protein AAFN11_07245, partial [Chloroflexota bacterium]